MKRTIPRLYRGFRDIFPDDLTTRNEMINNIRQVYESYGFVPLETPAIEYVDVLGKFLPESDSPEGGIFSFRNEDEEWIALRYDLTASLSRVVAQYPDLQRPFRRYQLGSVFRLEKPGPGRYREFCQFDFDTVGASSLIADTEVCCIMCDTLEAVGIERGQYIIRVNNRKVLNGVLERIGLLDFSSEIEVVDQQKGGDVTKRTIGSVDILRSIDKLDKIGLEGVRALLTRGRRDPSGDFTSGLQLSDDAVKAIENYLSARADNRKDVISRLADIVGESKVGNEGIEELRQIDAQLETLGYDESRVIFDPTVVRGLGYYTGPVFEGEITVQMKDDKGYTKSFGSVFGGGRYDDLVKRFTGQQVPATGASIGIDRLLAAREFLGLADAKGATAQVLVSVMDKKRRVDYLLIAQELRSAGIKTEVFMGSGNIGKQLKYADKMNIPVAVIAGSNEFDSGEIQVKDLWLGMELSEKVLDRQEWRTDRPAQFAIKRQDLVVEIKRILGD